MSIIAQNLETSLKARLQARQEHSEVFFLGVISPTAVDFSSNSYLSLSTIPSIRQAYLDYLESFSTATLLGSGGSRLLDGNSTLTESLEEEITRFHNAPAGLLFNSGFDANVGLFSCVPQPGDVIVYDELIHASVHDGMRASRAVMRIPFKHNTVFPGSDKHLGSNSSGLNQPLSLQETLLALGHAAAPVGEQIRSGQRTVFVAVEAVYSMDGDVAPLRDVVSCIKQHLPKGNGQLIVDEAHSTGLLGAQGQGLVCELGLENDVFARLHTFGKALGASGAILLCSDLVRQYLINYARTFIYTTAMPAPCLAGIKAAYDVLPTEPVQSLRHQLKMLTALTHTLLSELCDRVSQQDEGLLQVVGPAPLSAIIALHCPKALSLAQFCQREGFTVRAIGSPVVPVGSERVRVCLHASNTTEQIRDLVRTVEAWANTELKSPEKNEQNVKREAIKERARL